jgi:UDP-2-acetamido-3-amino-2,3-dideoxy-glucuronate N-acetyltransferase
MMRLSMDYFVHESSIVDPGAEIGSGTRIWHFCHVMAKARIGRSCSLGQNVFVADGVRIGDNVKIQNNVSLYAGVAIEDDVFLGPSMVFTNVLTPRSHVSRRHEYHETCVQRGATVGANATIVTGVTLGRYSFVGAGAVVTRDVPDFGLALGNPAKLSGWMCRCGLRLRFGGESGSEHATCRSCRSHYVKRDGGVTVDPSDPG